jgi:hypothetical protein
MGRQPGAHDDRARSCPRAAAYFRRLGPGARLGPSRVCRFAPLCRARGENRPPASATSPRPDMAGACSPRLPGTARRPYERPFSTRHPRWRGPHPSPGALRAVGRAHRPPPGDCLLRRRGHRVFPGRTLHSSGAVHLRPIPSGGVDPVAPIPRPGARPARATPAHADYLQRPRLAAAYRRRCGHPSVRGRGRALHRLAPGPGEAHLRPAPWHRLAHRWQHGSSGSWRA